MQHLGILTDALRALGAILEDADHTEYIVVVGGVAMNLRGYADRVTTDVDVIARRRVHMQDLLRMEPSDKELESAAAWVGTQDASEVFLAFIPEAVRYVRESRGSVG